MSASKVIRVLKQNIFNGIVWPDFTRIPSPARPIIKLKSIDTGKKYRIDGYKVTALKVNHAVPAVGYLIEDRRGKRLLYTGDSGPSRGIRDCLKNTVIHALIIETSLPNRFKGLALKTGHMTPKLLEAELKKIKGLPDRIFITHCKPRYKKSVRDELKKLNISNIKILTDGDVLKL
jgi:ribonuclease BN (tRNA processing enzyme)